MFVLRRWWDKHGLSVILVSLAVGVAWTVRQTQGAFVFETYRWLGRPFQSSPLQEEQIANARILELRERLVELENQNQKLKELLGYVSSNSQKGIVAPIVGRSADHWWQQVTLGRGRRDGIQVGDIVAGTGGLIGRIVQVTDRTSRVLLISDPSSQVGVTISRTRYTGYMRGRTSGQAAMEFFDKVPDVRVGDVVATSSLSQLFPAGFPVGRVISIDLTKSPAPEAIIEITAPISYLEWVVVYPNDKAAAAESTVPGNPIPQQEGQ